MRNLFISLLSCMILFACNKKKIDADILEISSHTDNRLNKIKFFDSQTGFAVGGIQFSEPTLLKTTDGGLTWNKVYLPVDVEQKEIYGLDIFSDGRIITVGYGGTVFISNDTGNTFQYVQHHSWKELKDITFRDADTAIIIGGIGFAKGHLSFFKTDGMGNNNLKEERNFELADIDFVNKNTGYVCGYGAILKTIDGGNTWNFTPAKNDFFKGMCWKNEQQGIAAGYEGSICKTSNGGETWSTIRNGNSITKKKLHFLDVERNAGTIVAVGEYGLVYISYDEGENWHQVKPFTNYDLRGIAFTDEHSCFVVGDKGSLFKITL